MKKETPIKDRPITVRNAYNILHRTNLSCKEIDDIIKPDSEVCLKQWVDSNCTDYSVYSRPEYLSDLYTVFRVSSSGSIHGMFKYFKDKNVDVTKLSIFDDYNGFGFTTLVMLKNGMTDVNYFNDVKQQSDTFKVLCKAWEFPNIEPTVDRTKLGMYDIYCTFEVIEHFTEPLKYIEEVDKHIKPGGHLVYTAGFSGCTNMYIGHLREYIVNNEILSPNRASHKVMDFIKEYYQKVYTGFNGCPVIFKKNN